MNIEPLESRIAPASVLTYNDVDGDKVTITSTVGTLDGHATIIGGNLVLLNLSNPSFDGASITFSVKKAGTGDGLVAVGRIAGGANDFGKIIIKGDLGNIDCGSDTAGTPAIKLLSARTIGRYGLASQGGGGDLQSDINGTLGLLAVNGDVKDAYIHVIGTSGSIGAVTIGGSLVGGTADSSGAIVSSNAMGKVKIGRDLQGGSGQNAGHIESGNTLGDVSVGGSIIGGTGYFAGAVVSNKDMGAVTVRHDVQGGSGQKTGYIECSGTLAGVTIGGSVLGGTTFFTGSILSQEMGPVSIGHDLKGGSGDTSGFVQGLDTIAKVTLGGSLIGGAGSSSGMITCYDPMGVVKIGGDLQGGGGEGSGSIRAFDTLAGVTVGGSLVGGSNAGAGQIFATRAMGPVAIAKDLRGGSAQNSGYVGSGDTLAGVTIGGSLIGGPALEAGAIISAGAMGLVKIGRDVQGSSGAKSGHLESGDTLAGVTIGGSLVGGGSYSGGVANGSGSGEILSTKAMGPVKIGHDLRGGAGSNSGSIQSRDTLSAVIIGGSIIGGSAMSTSGAILSTLAMGTIKIGHDLRGGSVSDGLVSKSGFIQSMDRIESITIGGSVLADIDHSAVGPLSLTASIQAGLDIGSITVKGDVAGTISGSGEVAKVIFSAGGQASPTSTSDVAIGKITIGGRVERAQILAGYRPQGAGVTPANGNAQIGAVNVGGDWIASDLVAGVQDGGASGFGDVGDTIIGGGASIAKIASIVIGGIVEGTPANGDQFGITSHAIGSVKISGATIPLPAAPGTVPISPITANDLLLHIL